MESVREMLIEQLRDLYDAEKQLEKALPKFVKTASNPQLKVAFENHLGETRGHVQRLERTFELLDQKAKSKTCEAMQGLLAEARQTIGKNRPPALIDSAIIAAAQKVEHYEIAAYGTVRAWARILDLGEVAELLEETLAEEREADQKLTEIAGDILIEARAGDEVREETGLARGPR